MGKIRWLLVNYIVCVCAIIIVALAGEVIFRLHPLLGQQYSFVRYQVNKERRNPFLGFEYIRPSATLGYELIPNSGSLSHRVNRLGFWGREYPPEKEKGVFRILLLGDSIAAYDWSREYLESYLNDPHGLGAKHRFEIWNAACPGYDVRHYAFLLRERGLPLKPDLVLIFMFLNDFDISVNVYYKDTSGAVECCFPLQELRKWYTPSPWGLRHSFAYRALMVQTDVLLHRICRARNPDNEIETGKWYMRQIKDVCAGRRIPLLVVVLPALRTFDEYQGWQKSGYGAIRSVLNELDIRYLDLHQQISIDLWKQLRENPDDDIHPNRRGHELIAREVFEYLVAQDN